MTEPVRVMVAPTGMSPVHTAPVVPTDKVPEEAVWSPLPVASPGVPPKLTLIPVYGVCPVLASVVV